MLEGYKCTIEYCMGIQNDAVEMNLLTWADVHDIYT